MIWRLNVPVIDGKSAVINIPAPLIAVPSFGPIRFSIPTLTRVTLRVL